MKTTKNYFPLCIHGAVTWFLPTKDTWKISLYMDRVTPRFREKKRERHWLTESHKIVTEGQHILDWAKCIKQIYTGSPGSDQSEYSECRGYSYITQE